MEEEKKENNKNTSIDLNRSVFDEMPAKFAFWAGLVTGSAILSVMGLIIMAIMMVKGVDISSDSKGKNDNKEVTAQEDNNEAANTNAAPTPSPSAAPAAAPSTGVEAASGSFDVASAKNVKGSGNVAIVEFSDFECPFCQRFNPTMAEVMEKYDGKVQHVYKHFPLSSIHPNAEIAAIGSECAGDQGKFWEMHDALFAEQDRLSGGKKAVVEIASELGLDKDQFSACLEDDAKKAIVANDTAEGQSLGCTGTPCPLLVVDGKVVQKFQGAVPISVIDTALAEYVN